VESRTEGARAVAAPSRRRYNHGTSPSRDASPSLEVSMSLARLGASLALALSLAACGDDVASGVDAPGPVECTTPRAQRYLPLAVGASWTFRVTPAVGTPVDKTSDGGGARRTSAAPRPGSPRIRVRTAKLDGATVSWQEDRCTSITRHREQTFDLAGVRNVDTIYTPDKIRIDETPAHTAMGASWQVSFTEVTTDAANVMTTDRQGPRPGRSRRSPSR
jgi:hypothetical protein